MGVDYLVSQIYENIITRATSTEDDWKAVCRLMGQIYRYDFDNVLLIYAQKPGATLVADYDTWKKVNCYVKRGSKGIAIFPTPLLRSNVRYVYDIGDTGGRKQKLTWNLEGENLFDYLKMLKNAGEIEGEIAANRNGQLNQLKAFTKQEIREITSSIEQREGRGLRQGNENDEVAVYRYVTKGTFDAYSWSLVENKQRFISQVMTSKAVSRTCEDIDEATLSYAEIKAVATGNPLIKEKMQIDNDVQRLKMLKASYDSQHYAMQDSYMIKFPKLIAAAEEKLKCIHEDVKERDKRLLTEAEFSLKVGGITYGERVDAGTAFLAAAGKCKTGTTTQIAEYKGFALSVEKNFMGANYIVLHGKTEYKAELSTSPVGCMTRLENLFNGIQSNIELLEERLEKYQLDMKQAEIEYHKPFQQEQELKEKLARQFELNSLLDLENEAVTKEQEISQVAEPSYEYRAERKENR